MNSPLKNDKVGFQCTSKFYGKEGHYLSKHSDTHAIVKLESGSIVYPSINSLVPAQKHVDVVDDLNEALASVTISNFKNSLQTQSKYNRIENVNSITQVPATGFSLQKDGVNVLLRALMAQQDEQIFEQLLAYFILFVVCRAGALQSSGRFSKAAKNVKQLPFFLRQAFEANDSVMINIAANTVALDEEHKKTLTEPPIDDETFGSVQLPDATRSFLDAAMKQLPSVISSSSTDVITRIGLALTKQVVAARDELTRQRSETP